MGILNKLFGIVEAAKRALESRRENKIQKLSESQYKAYKQIKEGMHTLDVIQLMGRPDIELSGADFVQVFRVGVIMSGGNREWLTLPHWVYRMKDDPQNYYLIVSKNERVVKHDAVYQDPKPNIFDSWG